MGREMTGGCQCGRVRYRAVLDGREASLCHCRMCQRATGGIHGALQAVAIDAVTWEAQPDYYAASPIARRGFCSRCGTSLSFEFAANAVEIELTVGSFDEPWLLAPSRQFGVESRLDAWREVYDFPAVATADNPNVTDRWRAAGVANPE